MAKIYGQLEEAQLHNKTSDPTAGVSGKVWFNTSDLRAKFDNGTAVKYLLANDDRCTIGTNGTANSNIRLHRGAAGVIQFVLGGDITAEGTLSTSLAQKSARQENYTTAGKPAAAAGNAGRVIWVTDVTPALNVDNGGAWKQIAYYTDITSYLNVTANYTAASVVRASLATGAVAQVNVNATAKTANYTTTTSDDVVRIDGTSGAFTITLHSAVGCQGQVLILLRIDNTLANVITMSGTVAGDTDWKWHTQWEKYSIVSNGTTWDLLEHRTKTKMTATATITFTSTGGGVAKGTASPDSITWFREGRFAVFQMRYSQTVAGTSGTGGYLVTLPNSLVADTTYLDVNTSATVYNYFGKGLIEGSFAINGNAGSEGLGIPYLYSTTQVAFGILQDGAGAITRWGSTSFGMATYATLLASAYFKIPISGWKE